MADKPTYEELEQRIKDFENEVAERERMEAALIESEEKLRIFSDQALMGIIILQGELFIYVNNRSAEIMETSAEEIAKWSPGDYAKLIHPDDLAFVIEQGQKKQAGEKGAVIHYRWRMVTPGGNLKWIEMWSKTILFKGRAADMVTMIDITERVSAEIALRESKERYHKLFEMESDAIAMIDVKTGNILEVNQAFINLYGYNRDEVLQMKNTDFSTEPDKTKKVTQERKTIVPVRWHKKKDGTVFPTEIMANIFEYQGRDVHIAAIRDITERKLIEKSLKAKEAQLQQSQKMETMGILAGGIAHEFNNLLYIISGNSELLIEDARPADKDMLQEITESTKRGANLVQQLMAFSRKSESNLFKTYLNSEIQRTKKMIDRVLPRMIKIKLDLTNDLYSIMADQGQIEQVIMNLCLNAKDAMPDGGVLSIKTENSVIDETFVDVHPGKPKGLKEGKCVILTISDTGCGMDEKIRGHIFEPFFTTKEIGKGTGLGLSVIYGIIEGHNGHISCSSEVGLGTTFRIYFPAVEDEQTASISHNDNEQPLLKGTETILIVDDEESVIRMVQTTLERLGYKTITVVTGESAIDIYTNKHEKIDLILLDLGMPGMGGKKCLEKLIEFDPEVKVIIYSGYSNTGLIQDSINVGAKGYAVKPLKRDELSKVIRDVLDKN